MQIVFARVYRSHMTPLVRRVVRVCMLLKRRNQTEIKIEMIIIEPCCRVAIDRLVQAVRMPSITLTTRIVNERRRQRRRWCQTT